MAPAILGDVADFVEVPVGQFCSKILPRATGRNAGQPSLNQNLLVRTGLEVGDHLQFLPRNSVEDAATGLSSTKNSRRSKGRENSSAMYISRPAPHALVAWPARIVRSFAWLKAHQTISSPLRRRHGSDQEGCDWSRWPERCSDGSPYVRLLSARRDSCVIQLHRIIAGVRMLVGMGEP